MLVQVSLLPASSRVSFEPSQLEKGLVTPSLPRNWGVWRPEKDAWSIYFGFLFRAAADCRKTGLLNPSPAWKSRWV